MAEERSPIATGGARYSDLESSAVSVDATAATGSASRREPKWWQSRSLQLVAVFVLGVAITAIIFGAVLSSEGGKDHDGGSSERDVATGKHGVVVTEHIKATEAGLAVLKAGGNAVDAAAAVQFVLNVVTPESTGIGGGCMVLIYNRTQNKVFALDGREEAPSSFAQESFCVPGTNCTQAFPFDDRVTGGHPVGVPGTLAAWALALRQFGTTSLAESLQHGISVAKDGFEMHQHLYDRILSNAHRLALFDASAELYLNSSKTGSRVPLGETFKNPDLAATFEALAKDGEAAFYEGSIGQAIRDAVAASTDPVTGRNGDMSADDMKNYRAVFRQPVSVPFQNGFQVVGHALPTSGGLTMGSMLNLLDGVGIGSMRNGTLQALHYLIDAQNIAFADRNAYDGDTDFVNVPVEGLVNSGYAESRRDALMSFDTAAAVPVAHGVPPGAASADPPCDPDLSNLEKSATTHFSIIDGEGNMVAATTTIEENMGAAVVVPGHGFLLNNELTDFDALPFGEGGCLRHNRPEGRRARRRTALAPFNTTMGGKRPRSSMTPTLVFKDGEPYMALGSPGGSKIIGTVLNVLVGHLSFGLSLREAVDMPRVVARNSGPTLVEDELFSNTALMDQLRAMGVSVSDDFGPRPLGFCQAATINTTTGVISGAADTKRLPTASAMAF